MSSDGDLHDRRAMRVASILNMEDEPDDENKCNRHAREMHATDPHLRDNGTLYHLWGDKRLYYCPECCVEFCEDNGIAVPEAEKLSKVALLVVSQQMPPSQSPPTDTPLWEECTDEDHHAEVDV